VPEAGTPFFVGLQIAEVTVVGVDLAIEMEQLAFAVANQAHNA
jgi:hypothetical protein